jgi:glycosyltransferase involved in cell wall biosynthesis
MSKPLVTVVVPTYRRPAMLRRAIQSVLRQHFSDFRVCIYDNASGDETDSVVGEFQRNDSRIEYIRRATNIGAYGNFVDGANRVETPFFVFLPDDDLMLPHLLEVAMQGFQTHSEAAFSILPTLHMSPRGLLLDAYMLRWPKGLIPAPEGLLCALRYGNPGLPAMLIRKEVWREFGGFDQATCPADDLDFQLRVMAHLPVFVSEQPGAIQIMHDRATTAAVGPGHFYPSVPRIIAKLDNDPGLQPQAKAEALEKLRSWLQRSLFTHAVLRPISRGKWSEAEAAATLLISEFGSTFYSRTVLRTIATCRGIPGISTFVRLLLALRAGEKAVSNLKLHWQFRSYCRHV